MTLNLGSGGNYLSDAVNVDYDPGQKRDLSFDLAAPFPIKDNSVNHIVAKHIVEHLPELVPFMNECHRVLQPGGILEIETPKPTTEFFWQDPTHVRGYVANCFEIYFTWCPLYTHIKRWSAVQTREEDWKINGLFAQLLFMKMVK